MLIKNDPESRFVLADCLVNLGRPEEGFIEYEKIFAVADYPRAYLPFGELLAERGERKAAKSYLTLAAVFERTPQNRARAHYVLGFVHLELQEFELAAQSLGIANELYPNDPATLSLLAEAKTGGGQTDEAIGLYQDAIRLDGNNGDTHHRLGLLLLKSKRFDEAIDHFESALAIDPQNATIEKNLVIARGMQSQK